MFFQVITYMYCFQARPRLEYFEKPVYFRSRQGMRSFENWCLIFEYLLVNFKKEKLNYKK